MTTDYKNIEALRARAKTISGILKSISNENRLMAICYLLKGERTVGELTDFLQMTQPAVSQMLAKMRDDGVLVSRQESQKVLYSIENQMIVSIFNTLNSLCEDINDNQ